MPLSSKYAQLWQISNEFGKGKQLCCANFKEYPASERHLFNFYMQAMSDVIGRAKKDPKTRKRRQRRRDSELSRYGDFYEEFVQAYNSHGVHVHLDPNDKTGSDELDTDGLFDDLSEEKDATDREQDSSEYEFEEEPIPFRRLRAFIALMIPISVSAGVGVYLAKLQVEAAKKKP